MCDLADRMQCMAAWRARAAAPPRRAAMSRYSRLSAGALTSAAQLWRGHAHASVNVLVTGFGTVLALAMSASR